MSKKSISAWIKAKSGWGGPYEAIVEAALYHAQHSDHPDIAFEGTTLELATALYLEHAKKAGATGGLYCTWRHVAEKLVNSLRLQPGQTVFIPGMGLGALDSAVRTLEPQAKVVGVECQDWLVRVGQAAGLPVEGGDFLNGVAVPQFAQRIPFCDTVLCNPPMGRLWGHNAVEREFLDRIAGLTHTSQKVAILLPGEPGHFWKQLPNKFANLRSTFHIEEEEFIANAAAPKSIIVTRYLLERS